MAGALGIASRFLRSETIEIWKLIGMRTICNDLRQAHGSCVLLTAVQADPQYSHPNQVTIQLATSQPITVPTHKGIIQAAVCGEGTGTGSSSAEHAMPLPHFPGVCSGGSGGSGDSNGSGGSGGSG